MTRVLVLGGGPDAEREISLQSANAVAEALRESGAFEVEYRTIDGLDEALLRALPGDVVFPVLHGLWGEGGPLQDLLVADGRPYVGSGPDAARACMDKVATKLGASALGIATPLSGVLGPGDAEPPIGLPLVLKPVHEGSSVGLHLCRTAEEWAVARETALRDSRGSGRPYLVERLIPGRELTVPLLGPRDRLEALPIVEIMPAEGVYDYAAKYTRGDTRYTVGPDLADGLTVRLQREAVTLAESLGVRHLARVDFILPPDGEAQFLELNTMPGFTGTSLLPKAAAHVGLSFPAVCERLVGFAVST